jgi:hypothetical protein
MRCRCHRTCVRRYKSVVRFVKTDTLFKNDLESTDDINGSHYSFPKTETIATGERLIHNTYLLHFYTPLQPQAIQQLHELSYFVCKDDSRRLEE